MNSISAPNTGHPGNRQLDRLRAGLLDQQPALKSQLLEHLRDCAPCRRQAAAMDTLAASQRAQPDPRLAQQLRARRMAALAGRAAQPPMAVRRLAPAFALATVMAVAIGVGVFLDFNPLPAPQELAQTATDNVPDLYADIDFYLWLSNHPTTNNTDADRS